MISFAYVAENSKYLVEHWLRTCARGNVHVTGRKIHLICPSSARPLADSLRGANPFIEQVWEIPKEDAELRALVASNDGASVTLPVSMDTLPLSHIPGANIPELRPVYPIVSQLWSLGFRHYSLHTLGGAFDLSIPHWLDEFANRHKGQRCFVVGNGPSLNNIDMRALKNEITLGSNRCYLGYDDWGYRFTYWCFSDELQIERYSQEYEDNIPDETVKFVPFRYLPLLHMPHACPLYYTDTERADFFTSSNGIEPGHSVTYSLIQLAIIMGCNPIILIGADHRYELNESHLSAGMRHLREQLVRPMRGTFPYHVVRTWRERKRNAKPLMSFGQKEYWDVSDAANPTHFDHRYAGGETKVFSLPQPREAEKDFRRIKAWADANGIEILNATPNSALKVFTMKDYETLL